MAVDHFSLYQLTVETGTAFGDRYKVGRLPGLPNNDLGADLYELTQSLCDAHNMPAYEVSNHAREGAECLHNLIYWRYGDYAGIGPGAHGRLTLKGQKFATEAFYNPDKWLAAVDQGTGEKSAQQIDQTAQATEYLLMGLRIKDGIDLKRFENLAGAPLNIEAQTSLEDMGLLIRSDKTLKATRAGTAVLNSVISSLLEA
jgi:oxygen-independent coproporphyrinogen-3 oxidase